MAGKLKPGEVKSVLEALSGVNTSLASCLESLGESQKQLEKSLKCQVYLNHSLKPVQTAFVQQEKLPGSSESDDGV